MANETISFDDQPIEDRATPIRGDSESVADDLQKLREKVEGALAKIENQEKLTHYVILIVVIMVAAIVVDVLLARIWSKNDRDINIERAYNVRCKD
jgi:hypothetical protein